MEKLIKLSDAMDIVMWGNGLDGSIVDNICEKLEALPSADRPSGEWIETPNHTIRCSVCGAEFTDDIMDACLTSRLKYPRACSVCTARMKGADDE